MPQPKAQADRKPDHAPLDADDVEASLDEALDESFPASDPVAISVDHDAEPHKKPPQ